MFSLKKIIASVITTAVSVSAFAVSSFAYSNAYSNPWATIPQRPTMTGTITFSYGNSANPVRDTSINNPHYGQWYGQSVSNHSGKVGLTSYDVQQYITAKRRAEAEEETGEESTLHWYYSAEYDFFKNIQHNAFSGGGLDTDDFKDGVFTERTYADLLDEGKELITKEEFDELIELGYITIHNNKGVQIQVIFGEEPPYKKTFSNVDDNSFFISVREFYEELYDIYADYSYYSGGITEIEAVARLDALFDNSYTEQPDHEYKVNAPLVVAQTNDFGVKTEILPYNVEYKITDTKNSLGDGQPIIAENWYKTEGYEERYTVLAVKPGEKISVSPFVNVTEGDKYYYAIENGNNNYIDFNDKFETNMYALTDGTIVTDVTSSDNRITFESSNNNVIKVNTQKEGYAVLEAVGAGEATINVTYNARVNGKEFYNLFADDLEELEEANKVLEEKTAIYNNANAEYIAAISLLRYNNAPYTVYASNNYNFSTLTVGNSSFTWQDFFDAGLVNTEEIEEGYRSDTKYTITSSNIYTWYGQKMTDEQEASTAKYEATQARDEIVERIKDETATGKAIFPLLCRNSTTTENYPFSYTISYKIQVTNNASKVYFEDLLIPEKLFDDCDFTVAENRDTDVSAVIGKYTYAPVLVPDDDTLVEIVYGNSTTGERVKEAERITQYKYKYTSKGDKGCYVNLNIGSTVESGIHKRNVRIVSDDYNFASFSSKYNVSEAFKINCVIKKGYWKVLAQYVSDVMRDYAVSESGAVDGYEYTVPIFPLSQGMTFNEDLSDASKNLYKYMTQLTDNHWSIATNDFVTDLNKKHLHFNVISGNRETLDNKGKDSPKSVSATIAGKKLNFKISVTAQDDSFYVIPANGLYSYYDLAAMTEEKLNDLSLNQNEDYKMLTNTTLDVFVVSKPDSLIYAVPTVFGEEYATIERNNRVYTISATDKSGWVQMAFRSNVSQEASNFRFEVIEVESIRFNPEKLDYEAPLKEKIATSINYIPNNSDVLSNLMQMAISSGGEYSCVQTIKLLVNEKSYYGDVYYVVLNNVGSNGKPIVESISWNDKTAYMETSKDTSISNVYRAGAEIDIIVKGSENSAVSIYAFLSPPSDVELNQMIEDAKKAYSELPITVSKEDVDVMRLKGTENQEKLVGDEGNPFTGLTPVTKTRTFKDENGQNINQSYVLYYYGASVAPKTNSVIIDAGDNKNVALQESEFAVVPYEVTEIVDGKIYVRDRNEAFSLTQGNVYRLDIYTKGTNSEFVTSATELSPNFVASYKDETTGIITNGYVAESGNIVPYELYSARLWISQSMPCKINDIVLKKGTFIENNEGEYVYQDDEGNQYTMGQVINSLTTTKQGAHVIITDISVSATNKQIIMSSSTENGVTYDFAYENTPVYFAVEETVVASAATSGTTNEPSVSTKDSGIATAYYNKGNSFIMPRIETIRVTGIKEGSTEMNYTDKYNLSYTIPITVIGEGLQKEEGQVQMKWDEEGTYRGEDYHFVMDVIADKYVYVPAGGSFTLPLNIKIQGNHPMLSEDFASSTADTYLDTITASAGYDAVVSGDSIVFTGKVKGIYTLSLSTKGYLNNIAPQTVYIKVTVTDSVS